MRKIIYMYSIGSFCGGSYRKSNESNWILNSGFWDDNGEWIDTENWND